MSEEQLATVLKVDPQNIVGWELGDQLPTFGKAEELADKLRVPFGFLFLSKPPHEAIPVPDLRTIGSTGISQPSLDFLEVLTNTVFRQQWYSDYLREAGAKRLAFVDSCAIGDGFREVAARMTKSLDIDESMRERCYSWESFLTKIVANAEQIGVMVMQRGVVGNYNKRRLSVDEFRGFAIADKYAPLVFINARDTKAAKIFTIVHELCHLWIGKSGISNPDLRNHSVDDRNIIERFCNKVAAEVLVPRSGVIERWQSDRVLEDNIGNLARYFRVSRYVVARQAYEVEEITHRQYTAYLDGNPILWKPVTGPGETGGDFFNTFFARNGRRFTSGVLSALHNNKISYRDAATLLDQKIATLKKVSERLG